MKVIAKKAIYPYDMNDMLRLGEQTSMAERRADDATRDVVSWLKCEYLQDHIGDTFQGVITAVTNFGVFVELLDVYVEGLIHITSLPSDYYRYEEAHHRLVGERTRKLFCLGDELSVQVAAVNLDDRKVDFELVGVERKASSKKNVRSQSKKTTKNTEREKIRRGEFAVTTPKRASKKTSSKKTASKKASSKKSAGKNKTTPSADVKATAKKASTKKLTVRKRKAKKSNK